MPEAGLRRPRGRPRKIRPQNSSTEIAETGDSVTTWAEAVVAGQIVAGPHVRNACRRHLDDKKHGSERGLHWDQAAASRAIRFFPGVLRLAQRFEGRPFELQPSQKFIIGSLFGWKWSTGVRRFRRVYIEIGKGNGKPLALDTPIPTPTGWTTMGTLREGDEVLEDIEHTCRVILAHPIQFGSPCYRITFAGGEVIVAGAEHVWPVGTVTRGSFGCLRTTAQIAETMSEGIGVRVGNQWIVSCEPTESVPVRCITVDSPSHLFLVGRGMIPTHNSPLAAGIGMYCLLADGEPQAEVYAGASMKSQAMVIFRSAVQMWRQSPALSARLTPSGGNPIWNLADMRTGSFFRPISTDEAHSGPMPSCALLDEIHEHRDGHMIEMMERGFKSRKQPLLVMITNSGSDRQSACWTEHLHAIRVAAGTKDVDDEATYVGEVIDDTTFSFVCSLDKNDDPLVDEGCWVKSNPLLDVSMPSEELRRAVSQARAIPGKLNGIMRLHFCEWTDSERSWMPRSTLEACVADFDPAEHEGKDILIGADLARRQDFLALGYVVKTGEVEVERVTPDGISTTVMAPTFDAWADAWTPKDTLVERAIRDSQPYELWVRDGWLRAPPGKSIRFDYPAARIAEISSLYNIRRLAYDNAAWDQFELELEALGLDLPIIAHPQGGTRRGVLPADDAREYKRARENVPRGLWMPGSVAALESLIFEGRIRILNSPPIMSAFMSAAFEEDPYGNRFFSKIKATNRIDILVAITMAIGAAVMQADTMPIDITALVA